MCSSAVVSGSLFVLAVCSLVILIPKLKHVERVPFHDRLAHEPIYVLPIMWTGITYGLLGVIAVSSIKILVFHLMPFEVVLNQSQFMLGLVGICALTLGFCYKTTNINSPMGKINKVAYLSLGILLFITFHVPCLI